MYRLRRTRTVLEVLLHLGAAAAVAALLALLLQRGDGAPVGPTVGQPAAAAAATEVATPEMPPGPVERLVIPALEVDAPVVTLGIDATNRMEAPDRPGVVGWYEFTATPGQAGNATFAGHVNWYDDAEAAFAELHTLAAGDEVRLVREDGSALRYRVRSVEAVDIRVTETSAVLAGTSTESITLITCHGPYDRGLGQYRERLVVRAERT